MAFRTANATYLEITGSSQPMYEVNELIKIIFEHAGYKSIAKLCSMSR